MSRERGFDQYRVYSKGEGTVWVVALKCSLAYYLSYTCGCEYTLKKNCLKINFVNTDAGEKSKSEESTEDPPLKYEAEIASFNLFICLVAKYFNQGDLADV